MQKIMSFLNRSSWYLIGGTALFTIGLAVTGYLSDNRSLTDSLYLTVQLFTIETGPFDDRYILLVDIARWLAMVVSVSAIIKAGFVLFHEQTDFLSVRRMKDHTIIIGLGNIGFRLAKDCIENKIPVVCVELNPVNRYSEKIRELGGKVIHKDARLPDVLKKTGVRTAKEVFVTTNSDTIQIDLLQSLDSLTRTLIRQPTIYLHVNDNKLYQALTESGMISFQGSKPVFVHVDALLARKVITDYPVDRQIKTDKQPHAVFFGYTSLTRNLVREVCQNWHFSSLKRPLITVFADGISEKDVCSDLNYLPFIADLDIYSTTDGMANSGELDRCMEKTIIHQIFSCHETDGDQLIQLSRLGVWHRRHPEINALYFTYNDDNLTAGIEPFLSKDNPVKLITACQEVVNLHEWKAETRDSFARLIHEKYLSERPGKTGPADKPWEQLPEMYRQANRSQADHVEVKIRTLLGKSFRLTDSSPELILELEKTVKALPETGGFTEILAEMEHNRWNADRWISGWRYSPNRDEQQLLHNFLVPYSELPDDIKKYDRMAYRDNLIDLMKEAMKLNENTIV